MEALHLPEELIWDGKMEPSSPSSELFSFSNSEESWILENNFAKDVLLFNDNVVEFLDDSLTDGEVLCEFEYDVKQEPWLDGKSGMPICMDYSPTTISPNPVPIMKVQNPYEIIMELEKFYDGADLTQLTPPQTPPQETISLNDNYDISHQHTNIMIPSPCSSDLDSINSSTTSDSDIGIQIVDEILHNRAKDLPDFADDESMFSTTSSSGVSNSTDENSFSSSNFNFAQLKSSTGKISKKQTRSYGRGLDEKKSRKKEQNKNAATRYRQKKKEEMKEAVDEEQKLLTVHHELLKSVAEYKHEIKYLKRLIKEFYTNDKK